MNGINKNHNILKTFRVFRKKYVEVPLEYFKDNPYKTLISTLMSSRTKDEVTLKASRNLFKAARDFKELSKLKTEVIENLIYPVGFYKTKARYLKRLSNNILSKYSGIIPKKRDELITLPGVGSKTANLVLNRAFKIPAIAVDTHVHKIANMLGWVKTKKPVETEKALNKTLPKKYWTDINRLFVSIGRQFRSNKKLEEFLKNEKLI